MPNDIGDFMQNVSSPHGLWGMAAAMLFIGYKPFCVILLYEFRTMWLLQSIITMPIGAAKNFAAKIRNVF